MHNIIYRQAKETDREQIANLIAYSFSKDFASFCKDSKKLSMVLVHAIEIDSFYVADINSEIVGITACANNKVRGLKFDKKTLRKNFGFLRTNIGYMLFKKGIMRLPKYPCNKALIEYVAVNKKFQRRGIATNLLKFIFENEKYEKYELDVLADNIKAQECYVKLGFIEVERRKDRFMKVYMILDLQQKAV